MIFSRGFRQPVISGILFAAILFSACTGNGEPEERESYKLSGMTMGTLYNITLIDDGKANTPVEQMQPVIDSVLVVVNGWMSTFDPQSDVSRFNAFQDTIPFKVAPEVVVVVRAALKVSEESGGAFDITVGPLVDLWGFGPEENTPELPSPAQIREAKVRVGYRFLGICDDSHIKKTNPAVRIDLSAIAKGYGVDVVTEAIAARGYTSFLVDIGGEIATRGKNAEGTAWRIGVDKPEAGNVPGEDIVKVLSLTNMSVASSGDYRNFREIGGKRYSHEIDPRTGKPVENGMIGATVVAPACMLADAYATALMVMGADEGIAMIDKLADTEALIYRTGMKNSYKSYQSKKMKHYLAEPAAK